MKAFRRVLQQAGGDAIRLALQSEFKIHSPEGTEDFKGPNDYTECTKDQLIGFFKEMVRIRRMETKASQMYTQKKIRGFCHLYIGQEAICVGAESSLTFSDAIITAYRDHAWHLTRGGTVTEVIGEMQGKSSGCSKGKGGSMHMYKAENNFYGGNGIVGAQCPVGAGIAFGQAYENPEKPTGVTLALYGDGAANQGQLYEAMNMASIWNIPCIFICENNQFAMGTSVIRGSAQQVFYKRSVYLPGLWVDGMDVLACREAMRYAKEWCMSGKGPICMEMQTYRYMGHSMSDPGTSYRTRDEVQKVKEERDCITKLSARLVAEGLATEAELKDLEKKTNKEVDKEIAAVEAHEPISFEEIGTDIYDVPVTVRSCDHTVIYGSK
jgi:pyruvate dehydrogenase E1 component alpha subunit|uniref:Pyruvate dehydrogenase E1 component subunit alpha n=1 Tax=Eutreptiella gymnastica TaxID=73025 RepID=A0A7S4LQB7_9EUGL|eukprot:CAMPEP_0174284608 /NCGR_PEP_ID=MMETSP0809-20121228/6211_1 /TAXON_ID=73025 ORGANISM="Eutreptiella gymnastica-like, Strain CCMP1594" /NCGR_SAMPLE_ID=MMETSP0809 /ASSEMBLY_ACC=CAM_ASM_000658 /LENGTH=380 /DNA_ID=CAMNT_0015380171 /DNA_START=24 /DNA_END=1166 /DNA_ORIENTATION=+